MLLRCTLFGKLFKRKVVSDLLVLFHFFFRHHIKYRLRVLILRLSLCLLHRYFLLLFRLHMSLLRVRALYTLDRLIVDTSRRVLALLAHPVLQQTNSLQLWVQHYDCLNYNIKAPIKYPLRFLIFDFIFPLLFSAIFCFTYAHFLKYQKVQTNKYTKSQISRWFFLPKHHSFHLHSSKLLPPPIVPRHWNSPFALRTFE